jgi:CheY-like chemotaxis protein
LVLIVEDEVRVREIARRALEGAGYLVQEAANGRDALDLIARATERPGLLLTDVVLPGMSGPELARRVAELAPGTAVLLTSGYPEGEIDRRGLLAPGAAFIQKPFTPEALVSMVHRVMEGAGNSRRSAG